MVLNVHLSHAAVTGGAGGVGHLDNLNLAVLDHQIRSWCGTAAKITVNPVIDLNRCAPVDRYTPPADMVAQVELRDRHCVFPWCTRPARKCDKDHVLPYGQDGVDLRLQPRPAVSAAPPAQDPRPVALPRPQTGMFLWTSPYGYRYLVDEEGTEDVSPDRRTRSRHGRRATYSTNEEHDATYSTNEDP